VSISEAHVATLSPSLSYRSDYLFHSDEEEKKREREKRKRQREKRKRERAAKEKELIGSLRVLSHAIISFSFLCSLFTATYLFMTMDLSECDYLLQQRDNRICERDKLQ